ncbi:MAG: hypothetical protein GY953_53290, partial [bacterium]|nr:hypothetical protein [bacterium]
PAAVPADNERAVQLFQTIISVLGYLAYLYMLPVAALQRWLFRGHGFGVAECYVSLLFFYGQFLLLGALLAICGLYSIPYGLLVARLIGAAYLVWTLAGFYRSSKLATVAKGILLYLSFTVVSIGLGMLIAVAMGILS